jgi:hypothetical protein
MWMGFELKKNTLNNMLKNLFRLRAREGKICECSTVGGESKLDVQEKCLVNCKISQSGFGGFYFRRDNFIRVKKKLIGSVWEFGEKLIDCMLVLMEFHSR